eukprot:1077197-Prymnesium_polylepis.1
MQALTDVAAPRMRTRDQPSAQADMPPQPGTDGRTSKNYSKNASETGGKAARAPRVRARRQEKQLHEQFAAAEKKSFANLTPSKCGRCDALAMTQRTEACEA